MLKPLVPSKTYFFLIHGLNSSGKSMLPIKYFLERNYMYNTYLIEYPSKSLSLNDSILYVNNEILKIINKNDYKNSILIGQSLGGLISMKIHNTTGLKPKMSIAICSPLHGSKFLKYLEDNLHSTLQDKFYRPVYKDLLEMNNIPQIPPMHDYKTISSTFLDVSKYNVSNFDGMVYLSETMYEKQHHINIPYHNHYTIFFSPLLLKYLNKILF